MRSKTTIFIAVMCICACMISLWIYPNAPNEIPIHWGIDGEVDGTGPKWLLLLFPFLPIAIDWLILLCRNIDPKKQNYQKFTSSYDTMRLMVAIILLLCFYVTISEMMKPGLLNIGMIVTLGVGVMITILGNIMPRFRPNYFAGLKFPWTLSDDEIWTKTHRFGGRLWFVGGLLICASSFLEGAITIIILMIITILMIVIPMIYSYLLYRNKRKRGHTHD